MKPLFSDSQCNREGPLRIDVPRDRDGAFEPKFIGKHERHFTGFDDKIIAMYARGMTVREIRGFLAEMYGAEVTPDFIRMVTDAVLAEITAWQARPLEPMYPVVFFDTKVVMSNLMIGLLTPPMGLALFLVADIAKETMKDMLREMLPYYVPLGLTLLLITYIPELTTWIPRLAVGP